MLDIKLLRKDPQGIEAKLKTKDPSINLTIILDLDTQLRESKTKVENLKATRNEFSQKIGEMRRVKQDASEMVKEVASMADEIHKLDHQVQRMEEQYQYEISKLPNIPMDDIAIKSRSCR